MQKQKLRCCDICYVESRNTNSEKAGLYTILKVKDYQIINQQILGWDF